MKSLKLGLKQFKVYFFPPANSNQENEVVPVRLRVLMVRRHAERPPPLVVLLLDRGLEEGGEPLPGEIARVAERVLDDPHDLRDPREVRRERLHLIPVQVGLEAHRLGVGVEGGKGGHLVTQPAVRVQVQDRPRPLELCGVKPPATGRRGVGALAQSLKFNG